MGVEGSPLVGKGQVHGWVVFQPRGEEIDSVLGIRRILDEIAETTIDLMKTVKVIQRRPSDETVEVTDLFHSEDVQNGHVREHLPQ